MENINDEALKEESVCSSEESDGGMESLDQMKAIRKVSTRRQIRKKKCIKEGVLLKQTGSSFQRWKSRYFKLRGCRLYYAKTQDAEIFNELDVKGCSVAESSHKNINCSFSVIGADYQLILCADTRKLMDEWISAIRAQKNQHFYSREESLERLMEGHNWFACAHSRPTYCNVCGEALSGVTNHGLSCDVCTLKAHKRCAARASATPCKWSNLSSVGKNVVENEDGIYIVHQWLEGNLPLNGKCVVCDKTCGSVLRLQDFKCLWCKSLVHAGCRKHMPVRCLFGKCRHSILTPTAIHSYDSNGYWIATPSVQCASPLLVFVNSRSGDNQGVKFLRRFRQYLNPAQVFDLACCGPKSGLKMFQKLDNIRVLICSGDGSVGWVLDQADRCNLTNKIKVGVLPLGTGNDLAQVMGWGSTCDDDQHIETIVGRYERASVKLLDRWSVLIYEQADESDWKKKNLQQKEECEATVADHLSTMLNSRDHEQVIHSASALCKTIKSFVSSITSQDEGDDVSNTSERMMDCEMDFKYRSFDEKVTSLIETLRKESEQAKIFRPASDFDKDHVTSEESSRLSEQHKSRDAASKKECGKLRISSQVMLRANSLKKAVRKVIEHTEKVLDEQNQLTSSSRDEDDKMRSSDGVIVDEGLLCSISEMETLHANSTNLQPHLTRHTAKRCLGDFPTQHHHIAADNFTQDVTCFDQVTSSTATSSGAGLLVANSNVTTSCKDKKRLLINPLYSYVGRATMVERALISNAQTVCAPTTPISSINNVANQLFGTSEKCVMNNYFGIGLDAKIALEFHRKREEHPKKFSRMKNRMWYTMLGAKEFAVRTYKKLEERVRLECDGETIMLPPLQGIVILNIPSYMGGANFWGTKTASDVFIAPSYNDRLLEVVAVFSSRHLGMAIVVPDGVMQHHRIAQCRSVRVTLLGEDPIPVEVDGEAWMQKPGVITIQHKNTIQILARDRQFEMCMRSWESKQLRTRLSPTCSSSSSPSAMTSLQGAARMSDRDLLVVAELIETVGAVTSGMKEAMESDEVLLRQVGDVVDDITRQLHLINTTSSNLTRDRVNDVISLANQLKTRLKHMSTSAATSSGDKTHTWLEWIELEVSKLNKMGWCGDDDDDDVVARVTSQTDDDDDDEEVVNDSKKKNKSRKMKFFSPSSFFKRSSSKKPSTSFQQTSQLNLHQVDDWKVEQVARWLHSLSLSDYAQAFMRNDVQGKELLRLEASDIKEMGVTKVGHVKRLQAAINELRIKNPI